MVYKRLKMVSWNIWDALIMLASMVLLQEIARFFISQTPIAWTPAFRLLWEVGLALLGCFGLHMVFKRYYFGSLLQVSFNAEKPGWYVQIGLMAGGVLFLILSLGYPFLLQRIGVAAPAVAYLFEIEAATGLWDRLFLVIGWVIFFPLLSELVFRGYLYQAMESQRGNSQAILLVSLLFSLYFMNLYLVLPWFVAGIVLILVFEMTSSLYTSVFTLMVWQGLTLAFYWLF